jgi:carbamoyl-phosphate synthase large subunit
MQNPPGGHQLNTEPQLLLSDKGECVSEDRVDATGSIVVTAVGGGVGQSVLRALRLSPLPWQVAGCDIDPWAAGLYVCKRGYVVPSAHEPNYIDRVLEVLAQEQARILIPCSDPELLVLSTARQRLLSAGVIPLVSSAEAVNLCRDKLATYRFFQALGLPFARTVPAREGPRLADEVGFPLIVKPIGGSASRGVRIAFDRDQLSQYTDLENLIVQEYLVPENWGKTRQELTAQDVIQGHLVRQVDEISTQVLLDHEGNFLGQFTSCNVLKYGIPLLIDPQPNAAVEEIARQMASLLAERGLIGPCNLQCKVTERGPVFFEINPRFTGITAVRAGLGFNEVEAVLRRALLDEPIDAVRAQLQVRGDLVCSRYVTEAIVPRDELETVRTQGHIRGNGRGTSL